jgi:PAS domain S-box-containing protein
MTETELLVRKLEREKSARQQAELILEQKARELFNANLTVQKSNLELADANARLQQDIAERERAERALTAKELEARLLHRAATMAADTHSFEAAMAQCLQLVCDAAGWILGHAYIRSDDAGGRLIPTRIWYGGQEQRYTPLRTATEKTPLEVGVGLPGRVVQSGEPVWIVDIQKDENFPRASAFHGLNLKGAFAFPIKVGGQCAAVLEFFREQEAAEDPSFLQIIRSVSEQLGRVLERKRADENLRASEHRIRQIIDSALDAVASIDATGIIHDWNAQAQRMFDTPRENAVGRHVSEIILLADGNGAPAKENLLELITRGKTDVLNRRTELRAIGHQGRVFPIEISVAAVQSGGSSAYSIFLRDVSDRHLAAAEKEQLHNQLMSASRSAGMAEVATGVLHNVGNVLNSVNVSATLAADRLRASRLSNLARAAAMLGEHHDDLPLFLTQDAKGKQLPEYIIKLAEHLGHEQSEVLQELGSLVQNVEHIKQVVNMQQAHAKVSGIVESVVAQKLLDDAVGLNLSALERHHVQVQREYADVPTLHTDKHKVLQVLVNLISNAKQAMQDIAPMKRRLTLSIRTSKDDAQRVQISVCDNGVGISPEILTRIFSHGFTTRKNGHGFGLHSAALTAKELGGTLTVHSDGLGMGATFTLELPLTHSESRSQNAASQ